MPTCKGDPGNPDACRCQNLCEPEKIWKLTLQALRHLNCGLGGTPTEIFCYIKKFHKMPMEEEQVMCIVKDTLKKGICLGFLRRNYCSGKYYLPNISSGRCKRVVCSKKPPAPCRKQSSAGPKAEKCPKPQQAQKCPEHDKKAAKCPPPKPKCPKPKPAKPKCPPPKPKCPPPKPKCPKSKPKAKIKCPKSKPKPKCPKPKPACPKPKPACPSKSSASSAPKVPRCPPSTNGSTNSASTSGNGKLKVECPSTCPKNDKSKDNGCPKNGKAKPKAAASCCPKNGNNKPKCPPACPTSCNNKKPKNGKPKCPKNGNSKPKCPQSCPKNGKKKPPSCPKNGKKKPPACPKNGKPKASSCPSNKKNGKSKEKKYPPPCCSLPKPNFCPIQSFTPFSFSNLFNGEASNRNVIEDDDMDVQ